MLIQFGYMAGARALLFGDLIADLRGRGLDELADEFMQRGEEAFKILDGKERKWATYTSDANKELKK